MSAPAAGAASPPPCSASRIPDAIPDAPIYRATLAEMDDLVELLARAETLAVRYGAVRIDPPPDWTPPPLRMSRTSRFFVRSQTLPEAPFVDLTPPADHHLDLAEDLPQTLAERPRKRPKTPAAAPPDPAHAQHAPQPPSSTATPRQRARRRRIVSYAEDDDDGDNDDDDADAQPSQVIDLEFSDADADQDAVIDLDASDRDDQGKSRGNDPDVVILGDAPASDPKPAAQTAKPSRPPSETPALHDIAAKPVAPALAHAPAPSAAHADAEPIPPLPKRAPAVARSPSPPAVQPSMAPVAGGRPMLRSVLPASHTPVKPNASPPLSADVQSLPPVPRFKPRSLPQPDQRASEAPKPTAAFTLAPRQGLPAEHPNLQATGAKPKGQAQAMPPCPPAPAKPFSAPAPPLPITGRAQLPLPTSTCQQGTSATPAEPVASASAAEQGPSDSLSPAQRGPAGGQADSGLAMRGPLDSPSLVQQGPVGSPTGLSASRAEPELSASRAGPELSASPAEPAPSAIMGQPATTHSSTQPEPCTIAASSGPCASAAQSQPGASLAKPLPSASLTLVPQLLSISAAQPMCSASLAQSGQPAIWARPEPPASTDCVVSTATQPQLSQGHINITMTAVEAESNGALSSKSMDDSGGPIQLPAMNSRRCKPDVAMTLVQAPSDSTVKNPPHTPAVGASVVFESKESIIASPPNPAKSVAIRSASTPATGASVPQPPAAISEHRTMAANIRTSFEGLKQQIPVSPTGVGASNVPDVGRSSQERLAAWSPKDAGLLPKDNSGHFSPHVRASSMHGTGHSDPRKQAARSVSSPDACVVLQQSDSLAPSVPAASLSVAMPAQRSSGSSSLSISEEQRELLRAKHGLILGPMDNSSGSIVNSQRIRSWTGRQQLACQSSRSSAPSVLSSTVTPSEPTSHPLAPVSLTDAPVIVERNVESLGSRPGGPAENNQRRRPGVGGGVEYREKPRDVSVSAGFKRGSLSAILNYEPTKARPNFDGIRSQQSQLGFRFSPSPGPVRKPEETSSGAQAHGDNGTSRAEQPLGESAIASVVADANAPAVVGFEKTQNPQGQLCGEEGLSAVHSSTRHAAEQIPQLDKASPMSNPEAADVVPGGEPVLKEDPAASTEVVTREHPSKPPQPPLASTVELPLPFPPNRPDAQIASAKLQAADHVPQETAAGGEKDMAHVLHSGLETPHLQTAQQLEAMGTTGDISQGKGNFAEGSAKAKKSDVAVVCVAEKKDVAIAIEQKVESAQEVLIVGAAKTTVKEEPHSATKVDHPMPEKVNSTKCTSLNRPSNELDLIESKDQGNGLNPPDTRKRFIPAKKPNKRRRNHVSYMKWSQDASGRLTDAPAFQDSLQPITLDTYEKRAMAFTERMRKALLEDSRVNGDVLSMIAENRDEDWMRNPDILEGLFWEILHKGVAGKALTVNYGVDVEAEGAYKGESYVEWYGMDKSGRMLKQERKQLPPEKNSTIPAVSEGQVGGQGREQSNSVSASGDPPREAIYMGASRATTRTGKDSRREEVQPKRRKRPVRRAEPPGPKCHVGNLNCSGLLRHVPRMPGVNHSMFYIGLLFTRFCWHTEDAFLNSVSYLHHGSADKIWYAVPPKFADAFEAHAADQVFTDRMAKDSASAQFALMSKTTIFDPREVRRKGVEVYRIRHKPGSFVLTAPRAYHAGFNCGFNIAEAVNFANPTWFPVGRDASRFARRGAFTLIVPYEYLLFHEAKALHDAFLHVRQPQQLAPRVVNDSRVVFAELEAVVQEGERKVLEYAKASNCRIAMLAAVDVLVKNNQLGPEFGPGAGMVCSLCRHACHFYAEICGSCSDNREARCVRHFGQGMRSGRLCGIAGHQPVVVRRHDPTLLADILTRLEKMGGLKPDSNKILKRYTNYLRPWQTPVKSSGLRLKLNLKLAASRAPPALQKDALQKDKKKKSAKRAERSEASRKRDIEHDSDFGQKRKRRKADSGRASGGSNRKDVSRKHRKGKKTEPVLHVEGGMRKKEEYLLPEPVESGFVVQLEVATQSELVPGSSVVVGAQRTDDPVKKASSVDDDYVHVPIDG